MFLEIALKYPGGLFDFVIGVQNLKFHELPVKTI